MPLAWHPVSGLTVSTSYDIHRGTNDLNYPTKEWQVENSHFPGKMHMQLMHLHNSLVSREVSTGFPQRQFVPYSICLSGRKGCSEQLPLWIMSAFSLNLQLPKLCQPWKDKVKGPSLLYCCNSRSHFYSLAERINWILTCLAQISSLFSSKRRQI